MPEWKPSKKPRHGHRSMRNFLKCERCRTDHKRCDPHDRDWMNTEQKCARCTKLDYRCGPPVRKPILRKKRQKSALQVPNISYDDTALAVRETREMATSDRLSSQVSTPLTPIETVQFHNMSLWSATRGWTLEQTLELIITVRRLLSHELITILIMKQRTGLPNYPEKRFNAIHHAQSWLADQFDRNSVTNNVSTNGQELGGRHLLRLYLRLLGCHCSFVEKITTECPWDSELAVATARRDAQEWDEVSRLYPESDATFSCVKYVDAAPRIQDKVTAKLHGPDVDLRCESYKDLEPKVKAILETVSMDSLDNVEGLGTPEEVKSAHDAIIHGFPAFHIAMLNKDPSAAIQLWKSTDTDQQTKDVLSRTFFHLAVATQTLDMICQITGTPSKCNSQDCLEDLGLSPQATAVLLQDYNSFELLRLQSTDGKIEPQLLKIAIAADSPSVIGVMLKMKRLSPPFSVLIQKAIKAGSIAVAEVLLPELVQRESTSRPEIEKLANMAKEYGFHEFADKLLGLHPEFSTQEQAMADIVAYQDSNYGLFATQFPSNLFGTISGTEVTDADAVFHTTNRWSHE